MIGIWSFDRNCLKQPLEHVDWGLLCKKWRFLWFFYAIFSTSLGLLVLEGFPKFLKIFIRLCVAEKAIGASWWRFTVQKAIFSISPGLLVLDRSAWVAKISEKFYQVMRNLKRPLEQVDWGLLYKSEHFCDFYPIFSISPGLVVLGRSAWVPKMSENFYQVMRNLKQPLEQVDWGLLRKKWTFLWFFTQFSQFHQA